MMGASQRAKMKIFLSYAVEQRGVAQHLAANLRAEGQTVHDADSSFFAARPFDAAIQRAIDNSDLFIFLISPASVQPGRYTLSELSAMERRWPSPGRRVLAILVEPTPHHQIPPYLMATTLLKPTGDVVAEGVAAVHRLELQLRRARWVIATPVLVLSLIGATWLLLEDVVPRWLGYPAVGVSWLLAFVALRELYFRSPVGNSFAPRLPSPPRSPSDFAPIRTSEGRSERLVSAAPSPAPSPVSPIERARSIEPAVSRGKEVFACYAREDRKLVLPLAAALKDRGISLWVDQWDIVSGTDWNASIEAAVKGCRVFLIHLSPRALASQPVKNELLAALARRKRVLPVLLEACETPLQLHSIQILDLQGKTDDGPSIDKLAADLRFLLATSGPADSVTIGS
jgi:hypothetical protein